jgi:hypothetical protein
MYKRDGIYKEVLVRTVPAWERQLNKNSHNEVLQKLRNIGQIYLTVVLMLITRHKPT